jgi:hypothetical protein
MVSVQREGLNAAPRQVAKRTSATSFNPTRRGELRGGRVPSARTSQIHLIEEST